MPTGIYNHKPLTEEHKKNIGIALKGKQTHFWTKESLKKLSESKKGHYSSPKTEFKKGIYQGHGFKKGEHLGREFKKGQKSWNKGIHKKKQ